MRKQPFVDLRSMNSKQLIDFFCRAIPHFDHNHPDFNELCNTIPLFNKQFWSEKIIDPDDTFRRSTFLHTVSGLVISMSPSEQVRFKLLCALVEAAPIEPWETVLATAESASHGVDAFFRASPRECVFQLCQGENGSSYFAILAGLLNQCPLSRWRNDIPRYLAAIKKSILNTNGFISLYVACLLTTIAKNTQDDFRLWFESESFECTSAAAASSQQAPSFFTLIAKNLIDRINDLEQQIIDHKDKISELAVSDFCVALRRTTTFLLECLYYIAKNPNTVFCTNNEISSLLNVLVDLAQTGFKHQVLVKIVQHIVSKSFEADRLLISMEKKEKLMNHDSLRPIALMLTTLEDHPVELCETFELFCENCTVFSILILFLLDSGKFIDRIQKSEPQKIVSDLILSFRRIDENKWLEKITSDTLDRQLHGLSFFHAVVVSLKQKLTDPIQLCSALMALFTPATARLWDLPARTKLDPFRQTSIHNSENTPYRVIWNLCQQENGHHFLPVLARILDGMPKGRWQSALSAYIELTIKWFLQKKESLDLFVTGFLAFLVKAFSENSDVFFVEMVLSSSSKKTTKNISAPQCMLTLLAEAVNTILGKVDCHAQVIDNLLLSLELMVKSSAPDNWEPLVSHMNTPMNAVFKLVLDRATHPTVLVIFRDFLTKVTPESLQSLSVENARNLLKIPEFSKNDALLTLIKIKEKAAPAPKPVPKPTPKSALKPPAPKSASKKIADTKKPPADPKPKSATSKAAFFAKKPPALVCVATTENINTVSAQLEDEMSLPLSPPPSIPRRWADDRPTPDPFWVPINQAENFAKMGQLGKALWGSYVEQYYKKSFKK